MNGHTRKRIRDPKRSCINLTGTGPETSPSIPKKKGIVDIMEILKLIVIIVN